TRDRRQTAFLLLLGVPFWLLALVVRPAQGLARDYDIYAFAGITMGFALAWRWGRRWAVFPDVTRWSAAVAAAAPARVLGFLLTKANLDHGLARVRSIADGPPQRTLTELAKMREFLGGRLFRLARFPESTVQYGKAAEIAPSPNILAAWGMAARRAGDAVTEERAFTSLLERAPADRVTIRLTALTGLAEIALARGQSEKARGFVDRALAIDSTYADALALRSTLGAPSP